jgi:hypothetical protein
MAASSPLSRAVAQYISNQGSATELVLGTVTAVTSGKPTTVLLGTGRVLSFVRTLNSDTYTTGNLILVALLNRPVALGVVVENP